ncbi:hypothetical protein CAI21_02005 [Alkalilimnicola ehrlichii]|uniref:ABC3 transporter permease C-terminal domain-containing protein n=1 Tax=Alkalilimnicola ehrlichii TaxID=351052 RepID=A0A3E0X1F1_9GAMM|nr:FtsX-like permease family protein [Alkalilimnicola ehrlichii]RFA31411.1 hypothetical protein CAI21_02005 [Alkalilimnicola ehrlichii]RFA39317.1 hypothetical protein CAL65_00390 [Alkalilimnicola ehrlichii]
MRAGAWRLGLRFLRRDWRAGELRLLAAALVISVAAVSSVAWLAERVSAAGTGRAAELLAADGVARSSDPIPAAWREEAAARGLLHAVTLEFPSVVLAGERSQLVSVKAVEAPYPLRGMLRVQAGRDAPEEEVRAVPEPGTVWLEPRLMLQLDLVVGDALELGAETFTVSRMLTLEPDQGGFFGSLAPRLMLNIEDIPATGLVQPASRVRYNLMVAGDAQAVERYRGWLEAATEEPLDWARPGDQPGVEQVLSNAQRFLGLGALLTVVIAGVAILLTVRRYAASQLDRVAIMRCLGARQRQVSAILTWKLVWLGLAAGFVGLGAGFALQHLMLLLVADLLPPELPAPGLRPALSGWLVALAALLGFALPTVLRLRQVPPMRVLRRDIGGDVFRGSGLYVIPLAIIFLMMWWQAGDPRLAVVVFGAVLGTLFVLGLAGLGLVVAVRLLRRVSGAGLLWFSGIGRRPVAAVVQVVGVGLGLMALFLLGLVRGDLLDTWQGRIAEDAPNYFLINVQPTEVDALRTFLAERGEVVPTFYPMVRGRLTAINEQRVQPDDFEDPSTQRLLAREFNLSWAEDLYPDNRIRSGRWWTGAEPDPEQFSVEVGLAEQLGVGLGDTLTFSVAGESVEATVTSLREVHWDSFNVNFFVTAPSGLLDDFPATYISSFYLPPEHEDIMPALVRNFPSATVIDINSILATVRDIIEQGSRIVELMAGLTLLAGLLVLLAALQITGEERRFESALLRSLGASRARIRWLARSEFWLLGAAAGFLAAVIAVFAGRIAARELFQLYYPVNLELIALGTLIGVLVVWSAGAWGSVQAYRVSPMRLLRETRDV